MPRKTTTIRAPETWLREVTAWATEHGISMASAIVVLVRLGMRVARDAKISARQVEELASGADR